MTATELPSGPAGSEQPSGPPASQPLSSLRSIAVVTTLTFAQLLLQFAIQLVLAKYFGAGDEMDAYVAALAPPVVIATILSGSIGYVLVPMVAQHLSLGRSGDAAAVVSQVGLYLFGLTAFIAGGMALFAEPITALLCPGFAPAQQTLTAALLRVLSILILANSLISYLNALSHCYRRFAAPAWAGLAGTLATLLYVLLRQQPDGIFAVAWGLVFGTGVTVAILSPLFIAKLHEAASWQFAALPGTRRCLALLAPIVLAALYWRLDPLLDRWLGSYLPAGSIAHLGYAWRLVSALSLIGTSGLSIVAFPAISTHAAKQRLPELNAELAYAMRLFLFMTVPICVGLACFASPVVRLLFEHGRFAVHDTQAVSLLVVLYIGVIFGTGLGDLLSRTCYALQDMLVPALVSTAAFTLAALAKIFVVHRFGAAGLVAATSLYYLLNAAALAAILIWRLSPDMLAGSGRQLARSLASSVVACAIAALVIRLPIPAAVLPAAACGAAAYVLCAWLLGDEFAHKLTRRAFAGFRK